MNKGVRLEKFKERDNKRIGIIVFTIICILLVSGVILYRTFAIFEVNNNFNVINGSIEDSGNIYFAFYQKDEENGTYEIKKDMPQKGSEYYFNSKESYCAVNGVKDESVIPWFDKDGWAVTVTGLKTSRTKCNLYFEKGENLIDKVNNLPKEEVNSGKDGLYTIPHEDAEITYTDDETKKNELKKDELRYAGSNPNNYVWFNHELWRMIGFVNTPDGQRIKIVRNETIGSYSWDTSAPDVNEGKGINDWHQADLMILLNDFYYNNKENQKCYIGQNNESKLCSFNGKNGNINGVKYVQGLIDEVTWTIGNYADGYDGEDGTLKNWYNHERSSYENRNSEWQGKVGLIYTSDRGYSSAGTETVKQDICWETSVYANYYDQCKQSAYLMSNSSGWILSIRSKFQDIAFVDNWGGSISSSYVIFPTLYLKTDTIVLSNEIGSTENPYILA